MCSQRLLKASQNKFSHFVFEKLNSVFTNLSVSFSMNGSYSIHKEDGTMTKNARKFCADLKSFIPIRLFMSRVIILSIYIKALWFLGPNRAQKRRYFCGFKHYTAVG